MKKLSLIAVVAVLMLTMGSCDSRRQQVPFDDGDSIDVANADPSVYGVCGLGTSMNVLQVITDTGDTLSFDLSTAKDADHVFGGLEVGDRMVVLPDTSKTVALLAINQTTLLGNWVMQNPIDGSDEVGICIKEGGIAESINQATIVYRTWRLVRGQLEIVNTREDGSGEEETNVYDLVKLTADSLVYKNLEDLYEYSRQHEHDEYGKDIKLEEAEDFAM